MVKKLYEPMLCEAHDLLYGNAIDTDYDVIIARIMHV